MRPKHLKFKKSHNVSLYSRLQRLCSLLSVFPCVICPCGWRVLCPSVRDQLPPGKRPDRGVACSLQQWRILQAVWLPQGWSHAEEQHMQVNLLVVFHITTYNICLMLVTVRGAKSLATLSRLHSQRHYMCVCIIPLQLLGFKWFKCFSFSGANKNQYVFLQVKITAEQPAVIVLKPKPCPFQSAPHLSCRNLNISFFNQSHPSFKHSEKRWTLF